MSWLKRVIYAIKPKITILRSGRAIVDAQRIIESKEFENQLREFSELYYKDKKPD